MDNAIFDQILPYLSLGMMIIFAVFLVLGMLFGLGRGAKRSVIRLVTFVGLLIVAFLVTPYVANWVLELNVQINGQTPREIVTDLSDRLVQFLQENFGDYVVPFQDYIKEYALSITFAGLNLVLFFVLYLIIKPISWVIYVTIAHFAAPKRDRNGKRLPKHAGWGLLVGALQGVMLFVLFMFPLNGVVGIVDHAAAYKAAQNQSESHLATASAGHYVDSDDFDFNGVKIGEFLNQVNQPLQMYQNFMEYTGLQYLSNQAFEYQLTIRVKDADDINLVHDLNSGVELFVDAQDVMRVVEKFQGAYDNGRLDLTALNEKDYQVLRKFINKAFDLQILNVANELLGDMDKIFATPFNNDLTKLEGTDVYANSLYGVIIQQATTTRTFNYTLEPGEVAPTNYAQFAKGLQATIQYISEQRLNLVRDDIINVINFMEALGAYPIKYEGDGLPANESTTLIVAVAQGNLAVKDYFNLVTARLVRPYGKYALDTPLLNVLGERLKDFSTVKMLGLKDFDNLLLYSKAMDHTFDNDQKMKTLVSDLIPLFLGENAFDHQDEHGSKVDGNWEILGRDLLDVAQVLRNYVTIADDLNNIQAELIRDGKVEDGPAAQPKALLEYLSRLVISETEYHAGEDTIYEGMSYDDVKFQKVDELVEALYKIMNDFQPVKTFVISKLEDMQTGDMSAYIQNLTEMFDKDLNEWQSTLRSIVNMAKLINQSPLADLLTNFEDPTTISNLNAEDFMEVVTNMDASDVTDVLSNIMDVPEIGDKVQETLTNVLGELDDQDSEEIKQSIQQYLSEQSDEGVTIDDDDIEAVQNQITALQGVLNQFDATTYNALSEEEQSALKETELPGAIGALWGVVQGILHGESHD